MRGIPPLSGVLVSNSKYEKRKGVSEKTQKLGQKDGDLKRLKMTLF